MPMWFRKYTIEFLGSFFTVSWKYATCAMFHASTKVYIETLLALALHTSQMGHNERYIEHTPSPNLSTWVYSTTAELNLYKGLRILNYF